MGRLYDKVRSIAESALRQWGMAQVSLLRRAFDVGGHSFHGGPQWRPRESASGPFLGGSGGSIAQAMFVQFAGVKLLLGNKSELAAYHHFGTKNLPARPIVVMTSADMQRLKQTMQNTARSR